MPGFYEKQILSNVLLKEAKVALGFQLSFRRF